ncbi:hypothetical protein PPYR_03050 [Photinus pyralis]|uniref:Uncharacterized protein n=2 Tax=Photinus pyralis TaxID=7054 RepID=A0A5N4A1P2_PHOPY|nr:circadian clock-controlled protein-like [Photinus pyralis]KAB0791250.1 hypothetical protein PPYR_03050 [Photinus pyralis]
MKVYIFLCLISVAHLAKLPPSFLICKNDPEELPKCLPQAVEKALDILQEPIPELGIPSVDPMEIESLTFEGGSGTIVLNQYLTNVKIHNLRKAKVTKAELSESGDDITLEIGAFMENVTLVADYEINGHVLVVPIAGKGNARIELGNLTTTVTVTATRVDKDGEEFLKLTDVAVDLEPNSAELDFGELVPGNKQMSDEIGKTLNENWREVFAEFKGAYEQTVGYYLSAVANQLFDKVPMAELFPPP